jgi:hypothetical protein
MLASVRRRGVGEPDKQMNQTMPQPGPPSIFARHYAEAAAPAAERWRSAMKYQAEAPEVAC